MANESYIGKIGVIGNGSWGTALAKILTDNGNKISWWLRSNDAVAHLTAHHNNPNYLTSVHFAPDAIAPTTDLESVLQECNTLIFAVPSAYAQQVLESVEKTAWQNKMIISAIKGVLPDADLLLNDYLTSHMGYDIQNYVAITGPCHAEEVAQERLSYLTFSGLNDTLTSKIAAAFQTYYLNTTHNHDIWGAQFAAVLKNIYAIGAGMAHSLDYGDNFLSVYITNCYREMYHYLNEHFEKVHPSNEKPDFHTSAYLGDLLVTCYSLHSRNRTLGAMLGKGYTVKAATLEMNMVAEGYFAARAMQHISKSYEIALPLAKCIYEILWEGKGCAATFKQIEKMLS
ncbi:MAG TPA: NAD(P)H-dependent glycerol-3-phosphate dehydrogenase [Flavipsychrobacter sp.]|nr:NAD(P)H-dependent glycerol-3-phosphate dehydrogenase [Flavipsychrobacter sp.]